MDEHPPDGNERTVEALVCLRCGLAHAPAARECGGCGVAFDESTSVARRVPQPPLGTIRLTGGRVETLDADLVIGRNPTREPLGPHQRAVVHGEDDRTVSRRHIMLTLDGWEVSALSLGRDTRLRRRSAAVSDLALGASVRLEPGDTLHYGDNLSLQYAPSAAATAAGSSSAGDRRAGSRGRRTRSTTSATPSKAAQAAPTGRDNVDPQALRKAPTASSEGPRHHDRPRVGGPGLPDDLQPGGASGAVRPKSAVRPRKLAALAAPIVLVIAFVAWAASRSDEQPPPATPTIDASGGENRASADWSADGNGSPILEWEVDGGGLFGGPSTDTATSHEWAGVDAGTYTITVSARNAGGWSPPATATVQVTDSPLQPPPAAPTVDASGGENRASASWFADDNGSPILGWEVDGGGLFGGPSTDTATGHEWADVPAGTYTIRVRARNVGGWSPPATATVQVTDPPPQPPPATPTIDASGGENRASADWFADDNGSPILGWEIDGGGLFGGPDTDTATSHEWAGVDAGTYTIRVRALNAGGWSQPATATVQVTDPPPQPPPATPTIDASGGENRASADWFADDNGSPILGWEIDGGGLFGGPDTDTATSHEWAGVDAGTYTIRVRALNAGGWSQPATATVQVTDPPPQRPPATPTIDASGWENRASANWSADDNGSPILEWEINDDGMRGGPSTDTAASHAWTGVDAGTYTIRVRARNAGGWSQPATATVQVTDPPPQPPPATPTIDASGGESRASASWFADDNGSPILGWEVDGGGMLGDPGRTATNYEWDNVDVGTYTITVRARNVGGWSRRATSDVTVTQSPPDKPTITANGGENRASANWSADDNGSPILEWEIDGGGLSGGPSADTATGREWADVPAGTYTITVRARNAGGWSPRASATVQVTDPTPTEPTDQQAP